MPITKAPRAALSQVRLSWEMLTITVDLVPAQRSKRSKEADRPTASNVCPACDKPTKLTQKLYCSADEEHGPYTIADARKAMEVDGKLVFTSDDEVAAAKKPDVESRSVPLSLVPTEDLLDATLPSGNIYRIRLKKPDEASLVNFGVLHALVGSRPDVAFIGEAVVKGATKLYRLIVWQGDLLLTELIRPGEFYLPEAVDASSPSRHVKLGNALIDAIKQEDDFGFDPEAWNDRAQQRLARLRDALQAEVPCEEPDSDVTETAADLLTLLEESVALAT